MVAEAGIQDLGPSEMLELLDRHLSRTDRNMAW
jgi:hypothetical protein